MDFTREPIIETIITPKEGYKLVIRSSKNTAQEEYFVDAVEIVAFGNALFFRSLERPKAFLVPVSDYETVEVREARMVLKNAGLDRSIKIGGGREGSIKASREMEKEEILPEIEEEEAAAEVDVHMPVESKPEARLEKKRDRRRNYRKRRGRDDKEEGDKDELVESSSETSEPSKIETILNEKEGEKGHESSTPLSPNLFSALLQPPPTLISETIKSYRQNDLFKGAFYLSEDEQYKPHDQVQELLSEDDEELSISLQNPTFVKDESSDSENPIVTVSDDLDVIEGIDKDNDVQKGEVFEIIQEEEPYDVLYKPDDYSLFENELEPIDESLHIEPSEEDTEEIFVTTDFEEGEEKKDEHSLE